MISLEEVLIAEEEHRRLKSEYEAQSAPLDPRAVRRTLEQHDLWMADLQAVVAQLRKALFDVNADVCKKHGISEEIPF